MKKLSIKEASKILGISEQAVRKRISRGSLDSIKENGHVYVILKDDSKDRMQKDDYEQFLTFFLDEIEKKEQEIRELKEIIQQKDAKIDRLQDEVKDALRDNTKLSQGVHIEARKLIETFLPLSKHLTSMSDKKESKKKKKK